MLLETVNGKSLAGSAKKIALPSDAHWIDSIVDPYTVRFRQRSQNHSGSTGK